MPLCRMNSLNWTAAVLITALAVLHLPPKAMANGAADQIEDIRTEQTESRQLILLWQVAHRGKIRTKFIKGFPRPRFSVRSADEPRIIGAHITRRIAVLRPHLQPVAGRAYDINPGPSADLRDNARSR